MTSSWPAGGVSLELDGDRIRFTHPLLAPVCYEDMPPHRRRQLHRRLADLDVDPEERARHLAIAAAGPDEGIAAALDAAAIHAHRRGAAQVAAELAERAIALTPPEALERVNRRRITAAERCYYAGDHQKATMLLEEAVGSSTPGPTRADALCALAVTRVEDRRPSTRWRTSSAALLPSRVSRAGSAPTCSASVQRCGRHQGHQRDARSRRRSRARARRGAWRARPADLLPGDRRRDHILVPPAAAGLDLIDRAIELERAADDRAVARELPDRAPYYGTAPADARGPARPIRPVRRGAPDMATRSSPRQPSAPIPMSWTSCTSLPGWRLQSGKWDEAARSVRGVDGGCASGRR